MKSLLIAVSLLVFAYPLSATPLLEVSASVTQPAGSLEMVSDSHSVTAEFTMLVTGGTGSGYWTPAIQLFGVTNESGGIDQLAGGYASMSWPYSLTVGDPTFYAESSPSFYCNPEFCGVPFTFGVEQQFTLTLSASAVIEPSRNAPQPAWDQSVSTSAEFDGVLGFSSCPDRYCPIEASFTLTDPPLISAPEPGSISYIVISVLVFGAFLIARSKVAASSVRANETMES